MRAIEAVGAVVSFLLVVALVATTLFCLFGS